MSSLRTVFARFGKMVSPKREIFTTPSAIQFKSGGKLSSSLYFIRIEATGSKTIGENGILFFFKCEIRFQPETRVCGCTFSADALQQQHPSSSIYENLFENFDGRVYLEKRYFARINQFFKLKLGLLKFSRSENFKISY